MRLDSLLVRAFHDFLPFFYLKECGGESFKDQRGILIPTIPEMRKIVNHLGKIDSGLWQPVCNSLKMLYFFNRKYFKSIYFREPRGVLFEIATDPPGFAIDEPSERLGRDLKLPEQYESMRAEIESRLSKLEAAESDRKSISP